MRNKIYIVSYSTGEYEDWTEISLFATFDMEKAVAYCKKFNEMWKRWSEHYTQYTSVGLGHNWIKDEHMQYFERWWMVKNMNGCGWREIEIR